MGLFASRPEENDDWAGLPSEPLDPRSEAELLRDAPSLADPAGLGSLGLALGSRSLSEPETSEETKSEPSVRTLSERGTSETKRADIDPDDRWRAARVVAGRLTELDHTGSTNADLAAAVAAGEDWPHLGVLLTRDQRSGRGRLDRSFVTPRGTALAISVLVRMPDVPLAARGWIPLIAGVAMREAVAAQLLGNTVGLKWPNDVLVDTPDGHRKICGILAETTTVPGAIVIGAGVNTALAAADLPVPAATSFAALGATCDDDALLAGYLRELDRLLRALAAADGDAIASGVRAAAEAVCLTLGREVAASLPDGSTLRGRADSLAADGRLVIVPGSSASPVALSAGDIVHLR